MEQNIQSIEKEPTNKEILEAINNFSFANDKDLGEIKSRLDRIEPRLDKVESGMVTKDYLDLKCQICAVI